MVYTLAGGQDIYNYLNKKYMIENEEKYCIFDISGKQVAKKLTKGWGIILENLKQNKLSTKDQISNLKQAKMEIKEEIFKGRIKLITDIIILIDDTENNIELYYKGLRGLRSKYKIVLCFIQREKGRKPIELKEVKF
ncbi:hypothetical protein [Clostridium baratii]|uniref:hypothetical protein n=1 Tax=Clostridium baratii TaxID=1561 RepID=UPI0028FFEEA2|nr:hypothetical protein [Clostridium baratii]MDU1053818.1 hypothetical protein [Clostridium baratii]